MCKSYFQDKVHENLVDREAFLGNRDRLLLEKLRMVEVSYSGLNNQEIVIWLRFSVKLTRIFTFLQISHHLMHDPLIPRS